MVKILEIATGKEYTFTKTTEAAKFLGMATSSLYNKYKSRRKGENIMYLLLKPILVLSDNPSIDVDNDAKFIIIKDDIKNIIRGIASTSCNAVNIHPGDQWTDENISMLLSELNIQMNEWVLSKKDNPLTIKISGYYDEYGRTMYNKSIYYIEFIIGMKAPYLEEESIMDDMMYALKMWNCFKEDKDLEWAYKQKNFVHGLEEFKNE